METSAPPIGGDQTRGHELLAVIWVFTILALVVVIVKVFTKVKILKETALDDVLTVFSLILVLICTSLITGSVHAGMGRHAYYLSPRQRVRATKLNYLANPFGIMAYSIPNVSVAVFLDRILRLPRLQRWALFAVPSAQCVIAAISCVLLFTQCTPSEFLWDPTVPATCLPATVLTGYSYFVGAYSAFTDVFLAVVPALAFWKLQLRVKKKLGLCLLMGTTAFAAICAIVKTSKLNELANLADFTYATVDLLIWAVVEADVIIIAACIPSLRPFAISVGQSFRDSNGKAARKRKGYEDFSSKAPLAMKSLPPYTRTVESAAEGKRSHNSSESLHGVKQTTDIVCEWE